MTNQEMDRLIEKKTNKMKRCDHQYWGTKNPNNRSYDLIRFCKSCGFTWPAYLDRFYLR